MDLLASPTRLEQARAATLMSLFSSLVSCNQTFQTPRPFLGSGNIDVLNISLDGELRVSNPVAHDCYDKSNVLINNDDKYS